jgi:hypothetical protein
VYVLVSTNNNHTPGLVAARAPRIPGDARRINHGYLFGSA